VEEGEQFLPGDRVRVDPHYWDTDIAGLVGTVSHYPEGLTSQAGTVWVDFDVEEWKPGVVDGAEVDADGLRRV